MTTVYTATWTPNNAEAVSDRTPAFLVNGDQMDALRTSDRNYPQAFDIIAEDDGSVTVIL